MQFAEIGNAWGQFHMVIRESLTSRELRTYPASTRDKMNPVNLWRRQSRLRPQPAVVRSPGRTELEWRERETGERKEGRNKDDSTVPVIYQNHTLLTSSEVIQRIKSISCRRRLGAIIIGAHCNVRGNTGSAGSSSVIDFLPSSRSPKFKAPADSL